MSAVFIPSLELIRRTVAVELAYTMSRMAVLERIDGNPVGIAYRPLGEGTVALLARHFPLPHFNSVVGLRAGQERHIAAIVAWYRDNGVSPRFELVPGNFDAALGAELHRFGFVPSSVHASMIAEPDLPASDAGDPRIEPVESAAQMEEYLDVYVAGWGIPESQHAQFKSNVRPWRQQQGWSLYLGRSQAKPAAAGTLYLRNEVGYLADATTAPAFRGRGLQAALLRRRIADAGSAGADFVCSGADFLSTSHRNMARVGMRLQFVRSIWTAA